MNTNVSTSELRMALFELEDKLKTSISSTENCMKVAIRFLVASKNGAIKFQNPLTNIKRGLKIKSVELDPQTAEVMIVSQNTFLGLTFTDVYSLDDLTVYQLMNLHDQIQQTNND